MFNIGILGANSAVSCNPRRLSSRYSATRRAIIPLDRNNSGSAECEAIEFFKSKRRFREDHEPIVEPPTHCNRIAFIEIASSSGFQGLRSGHASNNPPVLVFCTGANG